LVGLITSVMIVWMTGHAAQHRDVFLFTEHAWGLLCVIMLFAVLCSNRHLTVIV